MCTGKTDMPAGKFQKYPSKHLRLRQNRWQIVMLQHTTQSLKVTLQKLNLKNESEKNILFLSFTKMMRFIKLHCMRVNSYFYQAACMSKKEQSCTSEIPIFILCSICFCSMAKLYLFTVFSWIGNLERGCNIKNWKIIIYTLAAFKKLSINV